MEKPRKKPGNKGQTGIRRGRKGLFEGYLTCAACRGFLSPIPAAKGEIYVCRRSRCGKSRVTETAVLRAVLKAFKPLALSRIEEKQWSESLRPLITYETRLRNRLVTALGAWQAPVAKKRKVAARLRGAAFEPFERHVRFLNMANELSWIFEANPSRMARRRMLRVAVVEITVRGGRARVRLAAPFDAVARRVGLADGSSPSDALAAHNELLNSLGDSVEKMRGAEIRTGKIIGT